MTTSTCYMCDAPATSREHVPPKCIFPEDAHLRKNLIKVPSCDAHNLRKSKDDELLRSVLACAPATNDLALRVVEQTVLPAWERRPHILHTFLPNPTLLKVGDDETISFTIDIPRFESSIRGIVRGLFFADTGKKLLAELTVVWGALLNREHTKAPFLQLIRNGERTLPPMRRGTNPKVFRYDFHESELNTDGLCRLRFYEGHPIYVTWRMANPYEMRQGGA
jgi:hypothetical protein